MNRILDTVRRNLMMDTQRYHPSGNDNTGQNNQGGF